MTTPPDDDPANTIYLTLGDIERLLRKWDWTDFTEEDITETLAHLRAGGDAIIGEQVLFKYIGNHLYTGWSKEDEQ
jgi:hypothetical protein